MIDPEIEGSEDGKDAKTCAPEVFVESTVGAGASVTSLLTEFIFLRETSEKTEIPRARGVKTKKEQINTIFFQKEKSSE